MLRLNLFCRVFFFLIVFIFTTISCSYKRSLTARNIVLLPFYSSNMVFEAGRPIVIKGKCNAGGVLGVRIEKLFKSIVADEKGNWEVSFKPIDYKEPFNIYIEGAQEIIKLNNVIAGKVWILLGDNWMANDLEGSLTEIYSGNSNSKVRYFQPYLDATGVTVSENYWKTLSPGKIKKYEEFTRILGDELSDNEEYAIGIINLSLPNSKFIEFSDDKYEKYEILKKVNLDSVCQSYNNALDAQRKIADSSFRGIERGVLNVRYDDFNWGEMDFPVVTGNKWYLKNRVIWLRKKFYVPEKFKTGDFNINLGRIRGEFMIYLNGVFQKQFKGELEECIIEMPDSLVRTWTNLITVRMVTIDSLSGFYSNNITVVNQDSTFLRDISNEWKYRTYFEPQIPKLNTPDYFFPHIRSQLFPVIRTNEVRGIIIAGSFNMFKDVSEAQIKSGLTYLNKTFKPEKRYLCLLPYQGYIDSLHNNTLHNNKQWELLHAAAVADYSLINMVDINISNSDSYKYNIVSKRIVGTIKK